MTAAPNVLDHILTLLSDNWNSGSTELTTPSFIKITDFKRYDFNENKDIVIAQKPTTEITPVGIGDVNKHEFENFNIDVRTLDENGETHWLNIIREIKRIFRDNKINPLRSTGSYPEAHVLEFDGAEIDLSDKTHHLWRKLLPTQLKRFKVIR